jgi:D-glycero-D-manno-heptose 1,7-bisphosphate phosphatase
MRRAVFLDRDGVINRVVYHSDIGILDTPFTPSQFKLLPQAAEGISMINRMGLLAVLVSNQPGIAKKHFDKKTFQEIEKEMVQKLKRKDAYLVKSYYCFHHPQAEVKKLRKICDCRKPQPGLLFKAAKQLNLNLKSSYLVGDSITDIQAGKKAGCVTFLVGNHKCDLCRFLEQKRVKPDFIIPSLYEAVKIIKKMEKSLKKEG